MNLLKYPVLKSFVVLVLLALTQFARAQTPPGSIKDVIAKIDTFNNHLPTEKLYMQFDKPYYAVGDTIWFKAYLLNANLNYSPLSSRLYVEVLNDSSKVIRRMAFQMGVGISWGNISLDGMREGSVTIRAYTNWMRNFGADYFFNRAFYISNPQKQTWLINANSQLADANNIKMNVKFASLDGQTTGLRQMQLRVQDGKKVLFKGSSQTTADGLLDVNFPLPDKTPVKNLVLVAQDKLDNKKQVSIPVNTHRAKDVDVQFMPEGGYMVAGLPSHVGFKVIGDDGRGVNVSGKIVNAAGDEVVAIQSSYKGIGTFDVAPQTGDVYTAKLNLPGGQTRDFPLPAIKASGTELRVRNVGTRDTMDISVFMSADLVKPGGSYYLVGQARGVVCFGASVPTGRAFSTVHAAKSLFPTGIVHFTLLNAQGLPLNERLTFVDHHDNLKISIDAGQKTFAARDSIPVNIKVTDASGKPIIGSFSMAVTDDNQVKADSTGADNIMTRFLLSSDLKGNIEDPAYYFSGDKTAWQALDALLLTQGWVGYDWKMINNPAKPTYQPEYEYTVNGKVGNLLNKPIANASVVLLAKGRYNYVKDTVTNADGRFTFRNFPPVDSATFVLEAQNKRHKVINAGITIDDNVSPDVAKANVQHAAPWYVNSDAAMLNFVKTNPDYHTELDKAQYGPGGKMLRVVNIRNTAIVKGSANLNGAGEADQVIDEETIVNANKITLGELLAQKVTGFREGFLTKPGGGRGTGIPKAPPELNYFIKEKKVRFVFDGVDVTRFYQPVDTDGGGAQMNAYYNYVKQYLDYFTAEDIKGIEVLYSPRNIAAYNNQNLTTDELLAEDATGTRGSTTAYLEITTRAGNGPFTEHANGIYVYKPLKTTIAKVFYRPRYPVKNAPVKFADLRSTIHWDPTVVTKNGETTVSFYAADKPATYTITVEGGDLKGTIGYQTQKITIGGK
ncbi:MAG: carboxypeptidase regulatory-like domain-containing protein [Bacteroidota bacterium]